MMFIGGVFVDPFPATTKHIDAVFIRWFGDIRPDLMPRFYRDAAGRLAEHVRESSLHPDAMYFPIVFLYRHSIELILKNICAKGAEVGDVAYPKKVSQSHDLGKLWGIAKAAIQAAFPDGDAEIVQQVGTFILRLQACDPGSDGFRYASSKAGDLNLGSLPDHIDFEQSMANFSTVYEFLDGSLGGIDQRLEYIREMNREALDNMRQLDCWNPSREV